MARPVAELALVGRLLPGKLVGAMVLWFSKSAAQLDAIVQVARVPLLWRFATIHTIISKGMIVGFLDASVDAVAKLLQYWRPLNDLLNHVGGKIDISHVVIEISHDDVDCCTLERKRIGPSSCLDCILVNTIRRFTKTFKYKDLSEIVGRLMP